MNKIIKVFKHIFIPHEHNDYRPHFFREFSIVSIFIIVIVLFSVSLGTKLYIDKTDMTATVLPAVLVDLTNNVRESSGVVTLARNSVLDKAAEMKANDMANNEYFAHTSPAGITPWHWFSKANYSFSYAGENLAIDFTESVDVENAWLNSPTHKANILNSKFTEIGIATAEGYYNGHLTTYVVQMFGKPVFTPQASLADNSKDDESSKDLIIEEPTTEKESIVKIANAPVVKGETTEAIPEPEELEIVEENIEFISVKNTVVSEELEVSTNNDLTPVSTVKYSKWYERFLFLTPLYTNTIYKIIIYIITIALILAVVFEFRKHNLKHIIYGLLLLVIIFCLVYINKSVFWIDFLV
jgi:hypothetical protein